MIDNSVSAANERALMTAKRNVETCEGTLAIAQRSLSGTVFVDQCLQSLANAKRDYAELYEKINGEPFEF